MSSSSAKPLPLRCKTKHGQQMVENLTTETTVADFKAILSAVSGIHEDKLKILSGFPPRPVDLGNDMDTIHGLGLVPRDTIIVEETTSAAKPTVTTPVNRNEVKPVQVTQDINLIPSHDSIPQGILLRHEVPSNNSCLFTSVHFCMNDGHYDESIGRSMRRIIAETVSSDPETFNEAILGRSNEDYCRWIQNENHWGGAIELAILSQKYSIEIVAVDTQNVRLNRFGEDKNYPKRILLIYDGIHYDPLKLELFDGSDRVKTIFASSDDAILEQALELAREAKRSRQFTDVNNFTLRCISCNKKLTGETQAQDHAKKTGHINFGEV